jgi:hypothetical protein
LREDEKKLEIVQEIRELVGAPVGWPQRTCGHTTGRKEVRGEVEQEVGEWKSLNGAKLRRTNRNTPGRVFRTHESHAEVEEEPMNTGPSCLRASMKPVLLNPRRKCDRCLTAE